MRLLRTSEPPTDLRLGGKALGKRGVPLNPLPPTAPGNRGGWGRLKKRLGNQVARRITSGIPTLALKVSIAGPTDPKY